MLYFNYILKSDIYKFNMQTYRKFVHFLKKLKDFARDEQWIEIITLDALINPRISRFFFNVLDKINLDYSINNLNRIIMLIRKKIAKLINYIDTCDSKIDEKYFYERELYCYYGFIELIVEGSIITEYLNAQLQKEYGKGYLSVLSKIDKKNPSILNGILKQKNINTINNSIIELYIFLKHWQDDQNMYHKKVILERHRKLRNDFECYAVDKFPYLKKFKKQTLYSLYFLNICPIIDIETIAKFNNSYIFKDLSAVIGGKSLGLAKLKANNIEMPKTYVIPVASLEKGLYVDEIEKLPNISYAVRSSATVEDGENYSFAGLFNTELNIGKNKLYNSIANVFSSVDSDRVNSYVNKFKIERPCMAVVLQKYYSPEYAGVWIGKTLQSGHLEYVNGDGEKLVSGKVTPFYEFWDNNKQKNRLKFKNQSVGSYLLNLQIKMGIISDFEFCIKDNNLIFLQFRPATKIFSKIQTNIFENEKQIIGIPASVGKRSGVPVFLKENPQSKEYLKNKILLADYTDPGWVPALMEVSAIITAEGGMLCHAAIIARELGVPCICGIGHKSIDILSQKSFIKLDGRTGIIEFED